MDFNKNEPEWANQLADFVEKEYQRRQMERKPFELQWRLNMEYLNGNQYLDIDSATQSIQEIPKLLWYNEREVFNQIGTICETRIARLTRQKPFMKVRPATGDDADVSAAKVSSSLLTSAWHEQDMDSAYSDYVSWLEVSGTCLWKAVWSTQRGRVIYSGMLPKNPEIEQKVEDPSQRIQDEQELQQLLGGDMQEVVIHEGDLDTAVVPAHEFFPDSSWREGLHLCRSVIHARAYSLDEIEEMWGQRVDSEEVDVITLQRVASGMGGLGYGAGTFKTATTKLKDHAVVKEYYERPSKKYPKGRFIVVAGTKCLHVGPMPYMIGLDGQPDFPFVKSISIHHPGCFWGKSIIERTIPIQRRYNALRNRKAEYLNLVAIGQWYEPEGSIDDDAELNNAPGNRIRYRPVGNGAKPEPVAWPSLPASFENELSSLMAEFTAVSGVSELSRMSEAPTGVKSGVALSIANEQDDTRVATTATRIANGIQQLGKMWIRMYRQFVQEPRLLRSVGPNRQVEVREWESSDLTSDDVIIENIAALAETPAQRRQMVFDLINLGVFNRPEAATIDEDARQKIFQLLEFGHWESGAEDDMWLQRSRARSENDSIKQGQMVPIMDFDDHEEHLKVHNRERMQTEYDQLIKTPEIGPMIDQMMRAHIEMHMQAVAQNVAAQQQQAIQQEAMMAQAKAQHSNKAASQK